MPAAVPDEVPGKWSVAGEHCAWDDSSDITEKSIHAPDKQGARLSWQARLQILVVLIHST